MAVNGKHSASMFCGPKIGAVAGDLIGACLALQHSVTHSFDVKSTQRVYSRVRWKLQGTNQPIKTRYTRGIVLA